MIFNKLRRRQSSSLPLSTSQPTSYIHHASTPPDWPTTPTQATPDVYITSPAEDDGLQTSVCVHRAVEHEPKKLKKHDENRNSILGASTSALDLREPPSPPAFQRSSAGTPDIVMPKKPSEIVRESSAKWSQILNRTDKNVQEQVESPIESPTGHVQWEGGHQLSRVTSSRESPELATPASLAVPKQKDTLRRRASKAFKSLTNRESLTFGSNNVEKQESRAAGLPQKRRNTLSDGSRPFSIWTKAATAHAIPVTATDDSVIKSPKTSTEGRRRSSTIARVEGITQSTTPPLPPLPIPEQTFAKDVPAVPSARSAPSDALPLEPPAQIVEPAPGSTSEAPKSKKLQNKRSKNTLSHLFHFKGDKQFRSPPPSKQDDAPVPPVPTIPQELAKAVADPDTPETSQTQTFVASPGSTTTATPKSTKSKKFLRHRRRATIGSISHSPGDTPPAFTQPDTPKTPASLRSRPFAIIDLRKGFSVRSLGKSKSKHASAKASPITPPPVPKLPKDDVDQVPETVMQRYKMSRPPPLQSGDSPQGSEDTPVPLSASTFGMSPNTVEFNEVADAFETALSSPTDSEGPATPMFGTRVNTTRASSLAPAIELDGRKLEENVPEMSFSPPTSEEGEQISHRPSVASAASETTLTAEDPLFEALDRPSSLGDLGLQLHEPATKTSTLDAHLKLDSLRFENFSFDAEVF